MKNDLRQVFNKYLFNCYRAWSDYKDRQGSDEDLNGAEELFFKWVENNQNET